MQWIVTHALCPAEKEGEGAFERIDLRCGDNWIGFDVRTTEDERAKPQSWRYEAYYRPAVMQVLRALRSRGDEAPTFIGSNEPPPGIVTESMFDGEGAANWFREAP